MSFANNELFTQLSEEQEEIVSGGEISGGGLESLGENFGLTQTFFSEESSALQTTSLSGPAGSVAGGSAVELEIDTAGINAISI